MACFTFFTYNLRHLTHIKMITFALCGSLSLGLGLRYFHGKQLCNTKTSALLSPTGYCSQVKGCKLNVYNCSGSVISGINNTLGLTTFCVHFLPRSLNLRRKSFPRLLCFLSLRKHVLRFCLTLSASLIPQLTRVNTECEVHWWPDSLCVVAALVSDFAHKCSMCLFMVPVYLREKR